MNGNSNNEHSKITYEWLDANQLTIDPRVQQRLDPRKVQRIADGFDPSALGSCTVSLRDNGTYVLLNGQHRTAGARQAGYTAAFHCEVHHGLTLEDEAHLFLTLNHQTTPSALSKFLVRITAGDDVALNIEAIVASHGWMIEPGTTDGHIAAVNALESVYRSAAKSKPNGEYGDITERVISTVTRAWGTDWRAANGQILMGVAQLFGRFDGAVNVDKLVKEMQTITPPSLIGTAKAMQSLQGGTLPAAIAKVLVGRHNNRLRINLLPEWVWTR